MLLQRKVTFLPSSLAAKLGSVSTNIFLKFLNFLLCAVCIHMDFLCRAVLFLETSSYQSGGHPPLIFAFFESLKTVMGFFSRVGRLFSEAFGRLLGCTRQFVLRRRSSLFFFVVRVSINCFFSSLCITVACSVSAASFHSLFHTVGVCHL